MPRQPSRARPADDVADRLHSAALHLLRRLRLEDDATGLSAPQLSALSVIVFAGPLPLNELARAEQVTAPTITRLVAGLQADGLIERRPDPDDARVTRVVATARGRRMLEEGRRRRVARLAEDLAGLSAREFRALEAAADILSRLLRPSPARA